jgi:hypothetical protein
MSVTFSNVDAAKHILEDAQDITGFDSKAMQVMLRSARSLLEDIAAQRGAELDSPRFPMPYCGFLKVLNYDVPSTELELHHVAYDQRHECWPL